MAIFLALTAFVACAREPGPVPGAATPAVVSATDFHLLHWFEGRWFGERSDGARSYEGYLVLDDSTMRSYRFADSTYRQVTDSGSITLRRGRVVAGVREQSWVVTALDTSRVSFGPWRGVPSAFTWRRTGPGEWTLRLTWDSAGMPLEAISRMRAVP